MDDVYKTLSDLGIVFVKHEHPPVFTSEEAEEYWKDVDATHVKNLFLRNAKGDTHYLFVVHAGKRVDLKELKSKIGESRLSFGSSERLQKYLGVTPGSVSLLGVINDTDHEVVILMDQETWDMRERLSFHPNDNTVTLEVDREDIRRYIKHFGNEMKFLTV
ncbi:MAG: prolyl-tRNA synthetase associated domain-containing protein [bacterium]|nr:prolyl-tRNA synthetase associated domain-containing protein [bacterium]